jgi:hypothetical protein
MFVFSAGSGTTSLVGTFAGQICCPAETRTSNIREGQMTIRANEPVDINISIDKIYFIIVNARGYDAKVPPVEPDPGSNPSDDENREIIEDYPDDASAEVLRSSIDQLTDDEVIDLIAITWVGRGDFDRTTFDEARELATERHKARSARYLMGMPLLGDYLEEGLSELGYSIADYNPEND